MVDNSKHLLDSEKLLQNRSKYKDFREKYEKIYHIQNFFFFRIGQMWGVLGEKNKKLRKIDEGEVVELFT